MTMPTKDEALRGRLNVRQLVLEAEALVEHSTPENVIAQMMLAAARIAQEAGLDADDYIRCFGNVLCAVMKRDLSVLIEFDPEDGDEEDAE